MEQRMSEYQRIDNRATPEVEKRWLSWTVLVSRGLKQSYIRPSDEEVAKRRVKGRAARAARKITRRSK